MAPIDPGSTIHWARHPDYTTSLLTALSAIPAPRPHLHLVFSSPKSVPLNLKPIKLDLLHQATEQVFSDGGFPTTRRKQRDSVQRRILKLATEYRDAIAELNEDPFSIERSLASIRWRLPYWDSLRAILFDHREFPTWDERAGQDLVDDAPQTGQQVGGVDENEPAEQEPEPMQDVEYHDPPPPAPPGPAAAHAPIAGPSNPRPPAVDPNEPLAQGQQRAWNVNSNAHAELTPVVGASVDLGGPAASSAYKSNGKRKADDGPDGARPDLERERPEGRALVDPVRAAIAESSSTGAARQCRRVDDPPLPVAAEASGSASGSGSGPGTGPRPVVGPGGQPGRANERVGSPGRGPTVHDEAAMARLGDFVARDADPWAGGGFGRPKSPATVERRLPGAEDRDEGQEREMRARIAERKARRRVERHIELWTEMERRNAGEDEAERERAARRMRDRLDRLEYGGDFDEGDGGEGGYDDDEHGEHGWDEDGIDRDGGYGEDEYDPDVEERNRAARRMRDRIEMGQYAGGDEYDEDPYRDEDEEEDEIDRRAREIEEARDRAEFAVPDDYHSEEEEEENDPVAPPAPVPVPAPFQGPDPIQAPQDRQHALDGPHANPNPNPNPNDRVHPDAYRDDDLDLTTCPRCSLPLGPLTQLESESHLRTCLDGSTGGHMEMCPVCDVSLDAFEAKDKEKHVDECCRGLAGEGPGQSRPPGGGEFDGSGGGEGGGARASRKSDVKRKREHFIFECDEKSVPKDDKTGEPLECSFCLDEFSPSTSLARLSCYCIFHTPCITEYWNQPGDKFCPLHREMDGITEVIPTCSPPVMVTGDERPSPRRGPSPSEAVTSYRSPDLNVHVRGKVVSRPGKGDETEGTVIELVEGPDAVQIRHPQLVTITTKPESQTLRSINTGQALLTLDTPLLPRSPRPRATLDDSSVDDDQDDREDGRSKESSRERASAEQDDEHAAAERALDSAAASSRRVTLHAGLVLSTLLDVSSIEQSPVYSTTFSILVDGPGFPPPRFDPASLAPPTPSFRPVHDPSFGGASATGGNNNAGGGILNSPTLQRALLSPLLSPQRRAQSQGSDMSVPPLSLGLSRTSRASFSAESARAFQLQRGGGGNGSTSSHVPTGLAALIPALVPAPPPPQASTSNSSSNPTSSPAISAVQTPPDHQSSTTSLASALTASLSTSAKKTAEEILSLRRNHDAFVRRAKAELEVLEARIEGVRNGSAGGGVVGGGGVVRGFGVPVVMREGGGGTGTRSASQSGSRERGRSAGRAGTSIERSPLGSAAGGPGTERRDSPVGSRSGQAKERDRDEDVSTKMREADQREEDERGRSRSRQRRRDEPPAGPGRSHSRTSKIAEATEAAAMGAREKGRDGSASGQPNGSRDANADRSPARPSRRDQREAGRRDGDDRDIPATLADDDEEEDDGLDSYATNSLLSATSAATRPGGSRGRGQEGGGDGGGATPTFIPSSSTKGLVAIPEAEELSLPPSETSRATSPDPTAGGTAGRERTATAGSEREEDAPFEMDEDVDVDFLDLSSRPIFQQQPPEFAFVDTGSSAESVRSPGATGTQGQGSAFRPGSYQRASALSASYAALLSSSAQNRTGPPPPPSSTSHLDQSTSPLPPRARSPLDGPFSPTPTATPSTADQREHPMTTSAREDVAAREVRPSNSETGTRSTPDPRDVRRGEQKIRDVLAMDVPSHRRALPRKGEGLRKGDESPQENEEEEGLEGSDDQRDRVGDLASPGSRQGSSKFQVGSLPIPVAGRPSSQAMSSWRPDPEREWALEREREKKAGGAAGHALSASVRREGSSWVPPPVDPQVSTTGDDRTPRATETPTRAVPLEIGRSTSSSGQGGDAPPAHRTVSSSLAQSLRNAPHGSFSARAERDTPSTANPPGGGGEQLHVPSEADEHDDDEDDHEDDDGVFLPPHLVADRRARKDEKFLSRSVSRS
ncbi:hypothetical protein JCM10212_005476 [Sporobolomyces blumeae]